MRIRMYHGDEWVQGLWRDSRGDENLVWFKQKWGSHQFSNEELEHLLEGEEITFNDNRETTGHLQYYTFQEREYFGFKANYNNNNEYTHHPVFNPGHVVPPILLDIGNSWIIHLFMRLHYYSQLHNSDGTVVEIEYIEDGDRQQQGIDVTFVQNGNTYIIDEKAQTDYLYRSLPTFSLELLNSSSGRRGWFINDEMLTQYYMFIWPHANVHRVNNQLQSVDDIEYVDYALVSKERLVELIETQYNLNNEQLLEYANRISRNELEGTDERNGRVYYKNTPFDRNIYLVYTTTKRERPVNLIVSKHILEQNAEDARRLMREG